MDPFAALGLAAAIVQFIDFGSRLLSTTREIRVSSTGLSKEHETLDDLSSNLRQILSGLEAGTDITDDLQRRPTEQAALRQLSQKCRDTAMELQNLLQALYSTHGGAIAGIRQAFKVTWGQRKVDELEARLQKYREELLLQLVAITSNQQSSILQEIQKLKEINLSMQLNYSTKLDGISRSIQQISYQSSIDKELTSKSGGVYDQDFIDLSDKLIDIANGARKISMQQNILRGLYFRTMPVRHHSIAEAHAKTFSWVFKSEIRKSHLNISTKSDITNFAKWLARGDGIYWISGKPGSGKSTLMKFLVNHPVTAELLSSWSQPKECVIASHYFWSAGTRLQKSLDGLMRSLLYEIFRQMPDLISQCISESFGIENAVEPMSFGDEGRAWSMVELSQLVSRLVACEDIPVRFCCFIDGLDEYDGQHRDVIKVLAKLASSPSIKLCLSSRPWNVFQEAYGSRSSPKLLLQDLTRDDIRCYTESILEEHPSWDEYVHSGDHLVQEITNKAQGVFLWVFLVVRSLQEGVTNGDSISTLQRRIRQLPQDLEAFFKHILNSVDPFYHSKMAQTFKTSLQADGPLHIMLYSMIDQCANNETPPASQLTGPMDRYDIYTRREQMRRRLDGWCKGLLEVQNDRSAIDYLGPRVNFLHRTVRDFLLTREMVDFLDERAPGFKASPVIFRAFVALIKSMPVREEHFRKNGTMHYVLADAFFYAYRAELESGSPNTDLVDELRSTVENMAISLGIDTPWEYGDFLGFVINKGLSRYLSNDRGCSLGARGIRDGSLLLDALVESTKPSGDESPDLAEVVSLLLERGSDPNRSSSITGRIGSKFGARFWMTLDELETRIVEEDTSISGQWLTAFSAAMNQSGLSYSWAARQRRILGLLIDHGANANEATAKGGGGWGDFIQALCHVSEHISDQHLFDVYVEMVGTLLRHGADPNTAYHGSSVSRNFFTNVRRMVGLHLGSTERKLLEADGRYPLKLGPVRQRFLAQIAEALLQHGADPSCISEPSELDSMFSLSLAEPIRELWEARRAAANFSVIRITRSWIWWPSWLG